MRKARLTGLCALLLSCCLALAGCFGMEQEPLVAATVNGQAIAEDEVTGYIEGFRSQNADYESDEGWLAFLTENGYTPETMRTYILDSVFVPQVLIEQQCEQLGITLTDSELDSVIEQERAYYEERYGENSWDSVLASYGYDEESWRENEATRLLEEQLMEEVAGDVQATRKEVQAEADENAYVYNGKHSRYLLFDDEKDALEAAEYLQGRKKGVTDKALAKAGYNTYYAGWSSLSQYADNMSSDYIAVLNELEEGQASDPLQQDDGTWVVIFCDEVFSVGADDESVDLDAIPALILMQIEEDARQGAMEEAFAEWMEELTESSEVLYNAMPDDLSYDVNVSISGT